MNVQFNSYAKSPAPRTPARRSCRLIAALALSITAISGIAAESGSGEGSPYADNYIPKTGNPRPVAAAPWIGPWNGNGTAYVACQEGGDVRLIEMPGGEVVKKIPAGKTPHHPYLTGSGDWVLVTTHHENDYILAIDTENHSTHRIETGPGSAPLHFAQAAADGMIAVSLNGTEQVAVISPEDAMLKRIMPDVGKKPRDLVYALDGLKLFVLPSADDHLAVFDTDDWVMREVSRWPTGQSRDYSGVAHSGMDVSQDGNMIAFTNPPDGEIVFVDAQSENTVGRVSGLPDPGNPSFLGDTGFVGTGNGHDGSVSIIDTRDGRFELVKTIKVGPGANIPNLGPDGRVYVTANEGDSVAVIDPETWNVVDRIEGLDGSHWMVFAPDGTLAYITNVQGSTVTVVSIPELEIIDTIDVGRAPNGIMLDATIPFS